jgi:hypothetical protein
MTAQTTDHHDRNVPLCEVLTVTPSVQTHANNVAALMETETLLRSITKMHFQEDTDGLESVIVYAFAGNKTFNSTVSELISEIGLSMVCGTQDRCDCVNPFSG